MKYFALVTRGSSPGSGMAVGEEEEEIWSAHSHTAPATRTTSTYHQGELNPTK